MVKTAALITLLAVIPAAAVYTKLIYAEGYEYPFDGNGGRPDADDISALWLRFGCGLDAALGDNMYIRAEFLYGIRDMNTFEENESVKNNAEIGKKADGVTVRVGVGINF